MCVGIQLVTSNKLPTSHPPMWVEGGKALPSILTAMGRLKTIWGMKFEFALRTAVAAFLASIYAMQPEVGVVIGPSYSAKAPDEKEGVT